MGLKKIWAYLNNSNLKIYLDLNPFVWGFKFVGQDGDDIAPDLYIRYIRILPLGIILTINSGRCNVIFPEDTKVQGFDDGL